MKTTLLSFLTLIFSLGSVNGQSFKKESNKTYFAIDTDIKSNTTSNPISDGNSAGKLGFSFKSSNLYGNVLFTVLNTNTSNVNFDSSTNQSFSKNILIPDVSGQGISNFNISIGSKSLLLSIKNLIDNSERLKNKAKLKSISELIKEDNLYSSNKLFAFEKFGIFLYTQANNTTWNKDSLSRNVYIHSRGIYLTYNFINYTSNIGDNQNINLSFFAGFEQRNLGGDYGFEKYKDDRDKLLGTQKLHFKGFAYGVMLELGSFYAKFSETDFGTGDIDGFNGFQSVITLGANINYKIATSN